VPDRAPDDSTPPSQPLPDAVSDVAQRLERSGLEAWLVGESLHALCCGSRPLAFEIATDAPAERSLEIFPNAIPTHSRAGVVTVPGPVCVDLVPFRCGPRLRDDLAHRDFTMLAMAWSPVREHFVDPHEGRRDLAEGLLRCVGRAAERLREDPLRALRAARLVAEHGYRIDPDLRAALPGAADPLRAAPAARKRGELLRVLLAPRAAQGLALLRESGLERCFATGIRADAGELVESLPADPSLRLAAWLRGTRFSRTLRSLRFGMTRSHRIELLLGHHPLDEKVAPTNDRAIGQLLRQLGGDEIDVLFGMREWELARRASEVPGANDVALARKRLEAIRSGIERVIEKRSRAEQRTVLALDGRDVMGLLGCRPGQRVGAALRYLGEWVVSHPECNTAEELGAELREWARRNPERRESSAREPSGR
jgi:tRNA nucleotidyltransferase (CCA-adding enzyme)